MAKYVERDVEFEDDVPIAPTIIIYYYSYIFIIFYLLNFKLVYSLLYITMTHYVDYYIIYLNFE